MHASYHFNSQIGLIESAFEVKEEFIVVQDAQRTEIVCFKSTMIKIFVECHSLFYQLDTVNLDERLYTLQGLLLVTTENRTVLNMYLKTLEIMIPDKLSNEIRFIERLLSCNYAKLNKSSSLWNLYKKLYSKWGNNITFQAWETVTTSCNQHFANYYCCNFIRWFHDQLNKEQQRCFVDDFFLFSKKHVSDPSIWSALGAIIEASDIKLIIAFIDSLPVTSWSPFLALLGSGNRNIEATRAALRHWTKDSEVSFSKGTPIVPDVIENDLYLRSKFMNKAWKTLFLDKWQLSNSKAV
ncbi:unnamed protein product [Kluyveromyces dobzhanskii CBS 2104]|uniref:WGS project CCBQ000000000 data, contig 00017 n=1 Tax=Kluyveromyces dobzhanskii CBS 2104 TaxID=1427455 RepID=A0A0A8L8J1_9SACH|nr:unnamed protein product [Kluyveromyces dobzhanskii CBS 2104]